MRFVTPETKDKHDHTAELKFEFRDDGSVVIVAEDHDGFVWNLLVLNPDGTFSRVESVPENIGFSVNFRGQIIEKNES